MLSALRTKPRQADDFRWRRFCWLVLHRFQLREPFRDDGGAGIDLQGYGKFLRGLIQMARQSVALGSLGIRPHQLGAQRGGMFDDGFVLRSVTCGLLVGFQRFLQVPSRFCLRAALGSLLSLLRVWADPWSLRRCSPGRLSG